MKLEETMPKTPNLPTVPTAWTVPVVLCLSALFLMASPRLAFAGCEKDTDCKGDRVCEQGACAEPTAASAPASSPVAAGVQLRTLGPELYGYGGARLDWEGAEQILIMYSISAETLRNGLGYRDAAKVAGGITVALAATGVGLLVAGLAAGQVPFWLPGLVSIASGMVVGFAVTLPSGVLAAGARTRAIERYNRAVEDGFRP